MGKRILVLLALAVSAAAADLPRNERVLVAYNAYSKESRQVARHYAKVREIPEANLCPLKPIDFKAASAAPIVYVAYDDFEHDILKPIRKCLTRVGKQKILYIVLSYDTPYRLREAPAGFGVALDAFLADVWSEGQRSPKPNPYYEPFYNQEGKYPWFVSLDEYRHQPDAMLLYSVWRLDAPTPALASSLVDKALEAEQKGLKGNACFDRRGGGDDMKGVQNLGYGAGDWDLFRAAQFAREAGFPVIEDSHEAEFGTAPAPARCDGAALYSGWYSLNHYNDAFTWNTGAIGFHLDSESAANPRGGQNWSANAIFRGITATSGAVAEPYLTGLPHPAGVFRNLFEGASVGDAFLRNTDRLNWQIINIGDPLYTPFPGGRGPFARK
jgi:uncharacterized protein (TIGR03790 family)